MIASDAILRQHSTQRHREMPDKNTNLWVRKRRATASKMRQENMGEVVVLRGHQLASRRAARVSQFTTSGQPRSAAKDTSAGQRAGGIPLTRQWLIALSSTPILAAMTALPPSLASTSQVVMPATIVDDPATCQGLPQWGLTNFIVGVPISPMGDDAKATASRLRRTRQALGYPHAADFIKELRVDKGAYSRFENAERPLTLAVARKIKKRFGVSLDWLMDGDIHTLRRDLAEQIINLREVA